MPAASGKLGTKKVILKEFACVIRQQSSPDGKNIMFLDLTHISTFSVKMLD